MERMERKELADFLRRRRALLQPSDVGLPAGTRRRTPGLRRHEIAQLTGMSPDYYIRLEQARGPQPSPQMLAALARALRLSIDERDHLFHLAGHHAPPAFDAEHVSPGLLRLLDALSDLPAQVAPRPLLRWRRGAVHPDARARASRPGRAAPRR